MAQPPVYAGGTRPIVVYANAPGTTIVVINPAPGGPPVVQMAGGAPGGPPVAMPPQEAQPQARPPAGSNAWFEEE